MRVAFVARGYPGLGHVAVAVAIATAFQRHGHTVDTFISYGAADRFVPGFADLNYVSLRKNESYVDWPGLDIYDDGLRRIAPMLMSRRIDLLILAGEYLLPPLARVCEIPTALVLNPEIMDRSDRNLLPARLFAAMFSFCRYLIPMQSYQHLNILDEFVPLLPRCTPCGPFRPSTSARTSKSEASPGRLRVVIGNGGGVFFPLSSESYSSDGADSGDWRQFTRDMTIEAIAAVVREDDRIRVEVFSCLSDADNHEIATRFRASPNVTLRPVHADYHQAIANADIVVSRAGAGFIADCRAIRASVVLWPLSGHDEQQANAAALAAERDATYVVTTRLELVHLLQRLIRMPRERLRSHTQPSDRDPAEELVSYISADSSRAQ
ncbi:MAG TPA: glycosyltransferase [Steroidobacteraceae bacterium]